MSAEEIQPRTSWRSVVLWGFGALAGTLALVMVTHDHPVPCVFFLISAAFFAWAGHCSEKADRR